MAPNPSRRALILTTGAETSSRRGETPMQAQQFQSCLSLRIGETEGWGLRGARAAQRAIGIGVTWAEGEARHAGWEMQVAAALSAGKEALVLAGEAWLTEQGIQALGAKDCWRTAAERSGSQLLV